MTTSEEAFQNAMNEGHSAAWDQKWEQAAVCYQNALAESPDNPKALMSLGMALFQSQQFEQSLEAYQRAVKISPDDPLPLEKVAQIAERLGDLQRAIKIAMQAAELYIKTGNAEKAVENWLRVTQLDPESVLAHSRLAMVHEKLNHPQQAVVEYLAVASLLQRAGQLDKTAEMVGRALRISPNSSEAKHAQAMLKNGQLLPKPARPKGGTGPIRMAQVRQLERTQPMDPNLDPIAETRNYALTRLAEVLFEYAEEGDIQMSRRGLQAIVQGATGQLSLHKEDRTRIVMHISQAIDAQTNNQNAQAAEELDKALGAGFRHAALYFNLGVLRAETDRLESALRNLQHSVKHADYALGSRLLMGQILRRMERIPEAVVEYMEALKLADSAVVPDEHAAEIRQIYEPLVEAQAQQEDVAAMQDLCDAIEDMLIKPKWRQRVMQAREQLPKGADDTALLPLAELLTQAESSRVIEAINKINHLARSGHLRTAMEEAYFSLKFAPTYLPLHSLMGELLIKEDSIPEAIAKFTAVAQSYNMRGESAQATNIFRRIIQLAPMDLSARTRLIEQLSARGQADEAMKEYIDLADIYYRLAELDMARKTYTMALRLAQQTGVENNWTVRVLRRMADIDMQRLDWKQAVRVYEQIRTLHPEDIAVRKNLIDLSLKLNQHNQALAELENFVAYLESNGRRGETVPLLEALVEENPDQSMLLNALAEEYRLAGRIDDAIAQLDALGEAMLTSGNKQGAIHAIESIIAMNPANLEDYKTLLEKIKSEQ